MRDLITFNVSNATLIFDRSGSKEMILKLINDSFHGDSKANQPILPKGNYKVLDIWNNCYGSWVKVAKDDSVIYDIHPYNFEWYIEDQKETK